jgi:uncharacterized membrane-anchored protein YjiN (DUF445 family)
LIPSASSQAADIERQAALRRMKWTATLLLVVMTLLFIGTYFVPEAPWVGYVRAFTEAAMVGALADWFAVTALFRRPLGLPIPHTAIIPRGKDQLGDALARFVRNNFLTPEVLAPRLARMDIGQRLGHWLRQKNNAERVARDAGALIAWLLHTVDNDSIRRFLGDNLQVGFGNLKASQLVARILELLTADGRHQRLMDEGVKIARQQLFENRLRIRDRIGARSPWWMPDFVDEEIYDKIMTEIEHLLNQVGDDMEHPARLKFNEATAELIKNMADDPQMIARGEQLKTEILEHESVQEYLGGSWQHLQRWLTEQMTTPESNTHQRLQRALARLGESLEQDADMRAQINQWLESALIYCVTHYREAMGQVISDTVRAWDGEATAQRVELQVGRDLQFIRINGTLVGGLAGLAIYTIVHALRS